MKKYKTQLTLPGLFASKKKKFTKEELEEAFFIAKMDLEGLEKIQGKLERENYRLKEANRRLIEALDLQTQDTDKLYD